MHKLTRKRILLGQGLLCETSWADGKRDVFLYEDTVRRGVVVGAPPRRVSLRVFDALKHEGLLGPIGETQNWSTGARPGSRQFWKLSKEGSHAQAATD